ncbi:hypothetical protein EV384_3024 [Micromonospora kangleipakensis]|uniref:Uncharacterized protein n=1 Tax=Micromonospora kangleipakensis TaxID=1077942 RepID=A0A4Q8B9X4_9ACTN|nr:hypothetical protein EV384_3024 [Micromonospora kangleipakensis]
MGSDGTTAGVDTRGWVAIGVDNRTDGDSRARKAEA